MFAKTSSFARQYAIRALMYTRRTRESVRNYYLTMMSHVSQAEVLWTTLEKQSQIDIILESLPKCFNRFKMNYNMNKLDLTSIKLSCALKSAKKSLMKLGSIHFTEYSIKPKVKLKGGNKNNKKNVGVPVTKLTIMKKPKDMLQVRQKRSLETKLPRGCLKAKYE